MVTSHEPNNFDPSQQEPEPPTVESSDLDSFPAGRMGRQEHAQYCEFCIERLAGLLSRRGERPGENAGERALMQKLLDHALYSAYEDCVSAGAKDEADRLIKSSAEKS